jgi:hypothetical protein
MFNLFNMCFPILNLKMKRREDSIFLGVSVCGFDTTHCTMYCTGCFGRAHIQFQIKCKETVTQEVSQYFPYNSWSPFDVQRLAVFFKYLDFLVGFIYELFDSCPQHLIVVARNLNLKCFTSLCKTHRKMHLKKTDIVIE